MLTHAIFIQPDSELIRESICACAKFFVDEENVHKSNCGRTKTLMDSTRKRHKKEDSASCYTDLLHFSTRKHNLVSFFGRIVF